MHKKLSKTLVAGAALAAVVGASYCDAVARECQATTSGGRRDTITSCLAKVAAGDVILLEAGTFTSAAQGGHETFPLIIPEGVSLIGRGKNQSIIKGSSADLADAYLLLAPDNTTLKDLKVEFSGAGVAEQYPCAVYMTGQATMDNVNVAAVDAGQAVGAAGYYRAGIVATEITNSEITADGTGLALFGAARVENTRIVAGKIGINQQVIDHTVECTYRNVDITSNETGFSLFGGTTNARIENSKVKGGYAVFANSSIYGPQTLYVSNSQLSGATYFSSEWAHKFVNSFDGELNPLANQ